MKENDLKPRKTEINQLDQIQFCFLPFIYSIRLFMLFVIKDLNILFQDYSRQMTYSYQDYNVFVEMCQKCHCQRYYIILLLKVVAFSH